MTVSQAKRNTSQKDRLQKRRHVMPAIMTSRQSAELDLALERNGCTAQHVKQMSKGYILTQFRQVLEGDMMIVPAGSVVLPKWTEKDGVIYFSVTGENTTGEEWITAYARKGLYGNLRVEHMLRSPNFKAMDDATIEVAVLKGELFDNTNRTTPAIRVHAESFAALEGCKLVVPRANLACLIRAKFSNDEIQQMGLSGIVVMHESINDDIGIPSLLLVDSHVTVRRPSAHREQPLNWWDRSCGFAFAVSQVT